MPQFTPNWDSLFAAVQPFVCNSVCVSVFPSLRLAIGGSQIVSGSSSRAFGI